MKKKTSQILMNSEFPVLLCVASGDTSADIEMRPFTVHAKDTEITIISNVQESVSKSPLDGEDMEPNEGVSEKASTSALSESFPVIAHCDNCNHDILAAKNLAAQMDGAEFHCLSCGEELSADYLGDFELASDDEDLDDASEEDVVDAVDTEEDEEDEASDEDDSEEEDMSEEDASDDEESDDSEGEDDDAESIEDSEDGDPSEEDDSSEEEDMSEEDASDDEETVDVTVEPVETEIAMISIASIDADLRLVQANSDRIEVFAGDIHVGRIDLTKATDGVKRIAGTNAFRTAFAAAYYRDHSILLAGKDSEELQDFGFSLATVTVSDDEVINQAVNERVEELVETTKEVVEESARELLGTLKIAMAGLNKGILEGPNLVTSIAATFKRYGVRNATDEAIKLVEASSEPFLAKAYEHALRLSKEGTDYVRGLSHTVQTASYKIKDDENLPLETITSATLPRIPVETPVNRVVASEADKLNRQQRFRSVISRLGR